MADQVIEELGLPLKESAQKREHTISVSEMVWEPKEEGLLVRSLESLPYGVRV